MTRVMRVKDGGQWRLGCAEDIAWIESAIDFSRPLVTELPPVFAAYCRVEIPDDPKSRARHDTAIVRALTDESGPSPWWLGYLEYGIEITRAFGNMPRTRLFGWDFVLIQAGADQALNWRTRCAPSLDWKGALPDLLFHADHSWMLFTSWDDHWSGVGGSQALVRRIIDDPELRSSTRVLMGPYE